MKKVLLYTILCFWMTIVYGQAVVVNSPATIAGTLQFGTATGWGADINTNIWTADVVFMEDLGMITTDGCDTVTNKAALAGKIVLVNRGTCNFSFKALQAQDWGAIGCIIVNNVANGGVAGMGAGTYGASVRTDFPAVMISFEDGAKIKAELANGPVNMSIGNIRFDHDIATDSRKAISHMPYGTYPGGWIRNTGDFSVTPAANITNKGKNIEIGNKANVSIRFASQGGISSEYDNQTSDGSLVLEVDSTRSVELLPFDFAGKIPGNSIGKGTLTYTVSSESTDRSNFDNVGISEFYLSQNIISKSRLSANLRDPFATISIRRGDNTNAEYLTGVKIPYGIGCRIDSILFYMTVNAPATLAGLTPEAILYGWNDIDGDRNATNAEISFLALGTYTFDLGETSSAAVVRIALEDFNTGDPGYTIPANDMRFFVGIRYTGTELPFFGFDEGMDYTWNNALLTRMGTITDTDIPYVGVSQYDPNSGVPDLENAFVFTNRTGALSVSLIMSGDCLVKLKDQQEIIAKIDLSPNPAKDYLHVEVALEKSTSMIKYQIFDNFGKKLLDIENKNGADKFFQKINLTSLSTGTYHINIVTDHGSKMRSFQII